VLALQPAGSSRQLLPVVGSTPTEESTEAEAGVTLSEPEDAWSDLSGAFNSEFTLPGRLWLLDGIDDGADEQDESDAIDDEPPDGDEGVAVTARGEEVTRDDS
jgi:hypothetical protein